jgi:MSHA biogenesis protein MshE
MRLLNQGAAMRRLGDIGMPADMLKRFREVLKRHSGMVLVTGPTGSGKTTTLYAALAEVNAAELKVITVEDPVEYRLPGLTQVQVNDKIELTFAKVLRSCLRQDPDVILVGEMRDAETAEIGLRAAITGHLVLSTLHTRDAISTPFRLLDMGVPAFMVSTSLQGVIAQRLVRLNCRECSAPHTPTAQESGWLTGMLASARPVVATAHAGTELATVVQSCGLVVPPEDPAAMTEAVRALAADPALRHRFGTAGYAYAQAHLDRDAVLQKFEKDVLGLTATKQCRSNG